MKGIQLQQNKDVDSERVARISKFVFTIEYRCGPWIILKLHSRLLILLLNFLQSLVDSSKSLTKLIKWNLFINYMIPELSVSRYRRPTNLESWNLDTFKICRLKLSIEWISLHRNCDPGLSHETRKRNLDIAAIYTVLAALTTRTSRSTVVAVRSREVTFKSNNTWVT